MFEDGVPAGLDLSSVDLSSVDLWSLDGAARVDVMCALARRVAHDQALLLESMAAVASRAVGTGFDADEVAFALCLPRVSAQRQVALALDLVQRLPRVLDALRDGRICQTRARVFSDVLMPLADDGLAREIADRFLAPAEHWTASQLRQRLLKAVLAADPAAAHTRYERSVENRRVSLIGNDDTTACLSGVFLPPAKAAAAFERVDAIARGLKRDGETRTLEQLRADVFCDLLTGISPAAGPIMRAGTIELLVPLATLTGQSDEPGTLAGYGPVTADIARQIAAQQAQAGRDANAQAGRDANAQADAGLATTARAAGNVAAPQPPVRWRYRVRNDDGTLLHHGTTRARPTADGNRPHEGAPAAGNPRPDAPLWTDTPAWPGDADRPSVATQPDDAIQPDDSAPPGGADRPGGATQPDVATPPGNATRRDDATRPNNAPTPCPPQPDDDTVRFPGPKLRSWVNARDTTCRAPRCTAPARSCDVDHTIDHADGGTTRHDNLGILCRHHHRLKHEGGFHLEQPEPGHFRWTSPNGKIYDVPPDPP